VKLRFKLVSALILAIALILALAMPAFAIADPDLAFQINAVWVYRNLQEDLDQLYIVDYTIDYTANPTENVTEAFLIRLMDGGDQLGAAAPCAYYDEGYDRGVVVLYFTAAEASGFVWEDPNFSMILTGNPVLAWPGDPPTTTVAAFDLWQDWAMSTAQVVLASRILWLADQLELAWSVDMIESTAAGSKLTSYGEDYFTNAIGDLREMAPYAFSGQVTQPEIEKKAFTEDYSNTLAATVTGTPLDLTPLADEFQLTREVVTTVLYYGAVVILFIVMMVKRIGSTKPLMVMAIPFVIGGAFFGVPLVITVLAGFVALAMIAYIFFYQKSSA